MAVTRTSSGNLQVFSRPFSSRVTGHHQQPLINSLLQQKGERGKWQFFPFSLLPLPCVVLNVVFHSCHHGTQTILISISDNVTDQSVLGVGVSKVALDRARPLWYIRREWISGCWRWPVTRLLKGWLKIWRLPVLVWFTAIFPFSPLSLSCVVPNVVFQPRSN